MRKFERENSRRRSNLYQLSMEDEGNENIYGRQNLLNQGNIKALSDYPLSNISINFI